MNVQTFINENPFSRVQWLIFAMCFVIVLLDGFDTAAIGFIAPSLITSVLIFGIACFSSAFSASLVQLTILRFITGLGLGAAMPNAVNTAQSSMPALAPAFYPTQGRGTGVAWMLGIGRFGGIAGSFLVAELTRQHYTFGGVFSVVAVAGVISCLALLVKQAVHPR